MTTRPQALIRKLRDDEGSVSFLVIAVVIVAVLFSFLLADGGAIRNQRRVAADVAQQAARLAAQQVDEGSRLSGELKLDPGRASAAGTAVIAAAGGDGDVSVNEDEATATVTMPVDLIFLGGGRSVTATRKVQAKADQ